MEFIYVGEIVNTHGIKGEVRLISDFDYKDLIFKKGFKVYIGRFKEELTINSYRVHKMFDMLTFDGINNINDVIVYKGDSVYINKEDIKIDGYFDEEIIGLNAYVKDKFIGTVTDIVKSKAHDILVIEKDDNKNMIPNISEFIEKIDLNNNKIFIKDMKGLINEN